MIMDADVLIDFIKVDRTVLQLIVRHVGPVHVVRPVADEVKEIEDGSELLDLGMEIIDPELEDSFKAAENSRGPTSFNDKLCMLTAMRHGFVCVSNDKSLRRLCNSENVPVLWSLQLLGILHGTGCISTDDVLEIANGIHQVNPRHITSLIVERFKKEIVKVHP